MQHSFPADIVASHVRRQRIQLKKQEQVLHARVASAVVQAHELERMQGELEARDVEIEALRNQLQSVVRTPQAGSVSCGKVRA